MLPSAYHSHEIMVQRFRLRIYLEMKYLGDSRIYARQNYIRSLEPENTLCWRRLWTSY